MVSRVVVRWGSCGQTDTTENIIFPETTYASGNWVIGTQKISKIRSIGSLGALHYWIISNSFVILSIELIDGKEMSWWKEKLY